MRKRLSILLLVLFGLSAAAPLLALRAPDDVGLPRCCRRLGLHHCAMRLSPGAPAADHAPGLQASHSKCPFCPQALPSAHLGSAVVSAGAAIFAGLVSHPAGTAQTESMWRIARDRSRQKRGPPSA